MKLNSLQIKPNELHIIKVSYFPNWKIDERHLAHIEFLLHLCQLFPMKIKLFYLLKELTLKPTLSILEYFRYSYH